MEESLQMRIRTLDAETVADAIENDTDIEVTLTGPAITVLSLIEQSGARLVD